MVYCSEEVLTRRSHVNLMSKHNWFKYFSTSLRSTGSKPRGIALQYIKTRQINCETHMCILEEFQVYSVRFTRQIQCLILTDILQAIHSFSESTLLKRNSLFLFANSINLRTQHLISHAKYSPGVSFLPGKDKFLYTFIGKQSICQIQVSLYNIRRQAVCELYNTVF